MIIIIFCLFPPVLCPRVTSCSWNVLSSPFSLKTNKTNALFATSHIKALLLLYCCLRQCVEQENFSVGLSSSGLSRMSSQVVHCVGEYSPSKVVGDVVWERTGGLGANFSVRISETAVLPLLNDIRKKVSLGCSHRLRIRPAMGMNVYLREFWRCFYSEGPFRKGNKADYVINLPTDLSRGKSKLWLPFGQQREAGWGNPKQEKWVLGKL